MIMGISLTFVLKWTEIVTRSGRALEVRNIEMNHRLFVPYPAGMVASQPRLISPEWPVLEKSSGMVQQTI